MIELSLNLLLTFGLKKEDNSYLIIEPIIM